MQIKDYFSRIEREVKDCYEIAGKAKAKGYDCVAEVEVPLTNSLAERVLGLISVLYPQIYDQKIVARMAELEKQYGSLDPAVALCIAEEIAKEKYCKFENHVEAMEAGVRVGVGYLTLGYVSSPIEGFIRIKVKKTAKGEDFLAPYYSGPIRSAGGSEAAFSLVIVDHLREVFGYAQYDPTEDEIKRGVHECYEYHERVTNLQYLPSEDEVAFLMKNLPIQLSGDPSEDREVFNYKDLERVETNFIRSGFALVLGEGIAQKAPKTFKRVSALKKKGFKLSGWNWMEDFLALQKKIKSGKGGGSRSGAVYLQDLVAGRPVFAHPSRSGSFRLRYGRSRNTGYSTLALHPATMGITKGFIAVGTQLRIEKPTKGCSAAAVDSIDGPIVKLKNGSLRRLWSSEEAEEIFSDVEEITYLGDLLVPYGDFLNRNHPLEKAGYVEQYWLEHLKKAGGSGKLKQSFEDAVDLSKKFGIPLHPEFIYYWKEISYDAFLGLIDWVSKGEMREDVLVLPYMRDDKERHAKGKRALELIGCEHEVHIESVILKQNDGKALLLNLGVDYKDNIGEQFSALKIEEKDVLELVNDFCKYEIRDKSGTFIGARMGRPEKAKLRKLIGSPHSLFPVGEQGGRLRSFQAAMEVGRVKSDFPIYYCSSCKEEGVYPFCEKCRELCKKKMYCRTCEASSDSKCEEHGFGGEYKQCSIDIRSYFDSAKKRLGLRVDDFPDVIKGVRGTSNKDHSCEHITKGILRAKHGLNVNKDGTIRYDMTEMPLTHFKAKEIGTSIEQLKGLGYEKDINGEELKDEDQVLEIFPHDIVLPACPASPDDGADKVFMNVTKFIDNELEKIYELPAFFNAKGKEDLVGVLIGCMAPHTAAVVVGRIIGFSKVQAMLASPYIHAAMRRDTDGDEAAVMLLMDLLINFSRKYIPSHRGGTQDAPLVLNIKIKANEVDDMIFDVDTAKEISLDMYEKAEEKKMPFEVKLDSVKSRLGGPEEFTNLHYSYETSDLNGAPQCSSYKTLPTMHDKVDVMMQICKKIRAVDVSDVARLVIERHFIRDTRGNLRKFSMQAFRCVGCNESYRRPPLTGKCGKCGGRLIFTISEGGIVKYMQPAMDLAKTHGVSDYLMENLELNQMYVESIFGKEKEKQEALGKWF